MRRKVLHLIDTGGPGGAETVFLELVDKLRNERLRSIAVVPERDWLYSALISQGIEPLIVSSRRSFDITYLYRLLRMVQRHRIDLIQTHLLSSAVYGSIVGRLARIPVVCTFHGPADLPPNEHYRRTKFRLLDRRANRLVFVSESLRHYFHCRGRLDRAPASIIANGIDANQFRPGTDTAMREELNIGENHVLVGAVGNVRVSKDYPTLLRAAALLQRQSPAYRFVIFGDTRDPIYQKLIALRRELRLEDSFVFAGFRDDVERIMRALDIYVTSSSAEGFSLSTVQAMASGIPVVATRSGGPEEIIDDGSNGVLVPSGAPDALANAIDELTHAPSRRRLFAHTGRSTVERRFALGAMIRNYEELYDSCILNQ